MSRPVRVDPAVAAAIRRAARPGESATATLRRLLELPPSAGSHSSRGPRRPPELVGVPCNVCGSTRSAATFYGGYGPGSPDPEAVCVPTAAGRDRCRERERESAWPPVGSSAWRAREADRAASS